MLHSNTIIKLVLRKNDVNETNTLYVGAFCVTAQMVVAPYMAAKPFSTQNASTDTQWLFEVELVATSETNTLS
jgi:hypothetical protein